MAFREDPLHSAAHQTKQPSEGGVYINLASFSTRTELRKRRGYICRRGVKEETAACLTLVVVLAPHEYAAPVGEVVGNDGQAIPPGFHHRLHVVEAGVAAQVGGLKSRVNLSSFLQLDDLLSRLEVNVDQDLKPFTLQ